VTNRWRSWCVLLSLWLVATPAFAQGVTGIVRDETGAALPGVTVTARSAGAVRQEAVTDTAGRYTLNLAAGQYDLAFSLINFAQTRRAVAIVSSGGQPTVINVVLHLALNADVTVTGKRTFASLADVENPAENLVGIAQAASQGAITAAQLDERPLMRTGEVMETVPGMIVTQHSGEGKANQYFLRGFNLDHGTDFSNTVAGMPVNMPSHAHGQGYSDLNFMIPEIISGVQFSKGPYYADQGDFATAGSANINYASVLDHPIAHVEAGGQGYGRVILAASPSVGTGHLLAAIEASHNDGPWDHPDDYRKINGVVKYSRGDTLNGWSLTAMGYHGDWNSTDQVPQRAITEGLIDRFGAIDPTDGGHSYRYSVSGDWQHSTGDAVTNVTVYGIGYDLDLFSNFTFYLDDPEHGDQVEQADHRFILGGRVSHRRMTRWGDHLVQNTIGVQVRNDDITSVGLYHTDARVRLDTRDQDSVLETIAGAYAQNDVEWTPWLRTMVGLRGDVARFRVDDINPLNSGVARSGLVSPKGGVTLGPWQRTEFYVDAGSGFHSNDARGTTITVDADGNPAERVTPLVRAVGAEVGARTVAIPHLQSTLTYWFLHLDSELVFSATKARPSRADRARAAASSSPTTTLRSSGSCWTRTCRGRVPASPSSIRSVTTFPKRSERSYRRARLNLPSLSSMLPDVSQTLGKLRRVHAPSDSGANGKRVLIEVLLQRFGSRSVLVRPVEEVDNELADAREFAQPRLRLPVPRIVERQVEKLECALERAPRNRRVAIPPFRCAADLAADVAELLREGQLVPAPRRQVAVLNVGHRCTNLDTRPTIASRVAASSTPRDRLPNDGRRLIIESNSSQSTPSMCG